MVTKLTYRSKIFHENEEVKGSVVYILTRNDTRTSVWAPKQEGRIISDIIAVNSVCQGKPIRIGKPGLYERGFVDPQNEDLLYLIDAENSIINCGPNDIFLFYDQDKVKDENQYTWHGTFEEFLGEFKKAGYDFIQKKGGKIK